MKNTNKSSRRYRSSLKWGIKAVMVFSLLLAGTGCHSDKDTRTEVKQPTTTEVTSCLSTTISTSTTSTISSTTTSTKTTITTAQTTLMIQPTIESQTIAVVTEPVYVEHNTEFIATPLSMQPESVQSDNTLPITDYERTLLRNVVASEYGSDTHGYGGAPVTPYERACVVAVVMNRVNDPRYPNTIEGVLTQPNQFSGYWACNYEWNTVTNNVRDGVDYYFEHPEEFGSWTGFYGDGRYNYFY